MPVIVGPALWHFINKFSIGEPAPDGGDTICLSGGGTIWIVAPASSEVIRSWYSRNDAVTTATNCTSATGWFVPTLGQLQNPGYECRTYWDSYSYNTYWSSTERDAVVAYAVLNSGGPNARIKSDARWVRAFRCVAY